MLDVEDGCLPQCSPSPAQAPREVDAAQATLDWDQIGTGLD